MPVIVFGALAIGLLLGVMGSGGSIVTVPVLVYLLGHEGKVAIAESLAIVGTIAFITLLPYAKARLVNWRNVAWFGVPGMAGTYLGAWLSQFIPEPIQLSLFAVVMLGAAAAMLNRRHFAPATSEVSAAPARQFAGWIVLEGLAVGTLTGIVGVGGGFLIVPALVLLGGLPMRVAVGTSLAVITMKSWSGFYKYLSVLQTFESSVDWYTVAAFIIFGVCGSFAGHRIATRLNQRLLQRSFAAFLILVGALVLIQEAPQALAHVLWAAIE